LPRPGGAARDEDGALINEAALKALEGNCEFIAAVFDAYREKATPAERLLLDVAEMKLVEIERAREAREKPDT
jgi:hypothetical protein